MSRAYGSVSHSDYQDDPLPATPTAGYHTAGSASIQEVCDQIRSNIFQINNGANAIERVLKSIGTERDSPQTRDKIHETSTKTNQVVQATTRLIRSANAARGDRQQKMQVDRLTSDFQDSVSRFQALQKKAMEKVKSAVKLGSQTSKPSPAVDTSPVGEDRQPLVSDDRVAQLQAQEAVIEDDLDLLREREERIQQLESDILDINEIFRDLGAMVTEQGDILNDIERNVDRAYSNVETGNQELGKAAQYAKKSRRKMCCLLLIFLIISVIITIIVVVSVKS